MLNFIKRQPSVRIIAFGFLITILIGSVLLYMPFSIKDGADVGYIDCLYTSTSAVCVTGLIAIDTADHFTAVGQTIVALLIQIGGLGVTAVGAGIILAVGMKINLKEINVIKDAMNLDSGKGIKHFIRDVFLTTIIIEIVGAIINFTVFIQDYPLKKALGISIFHSIAAFNNSGFDILGGYQNLIPYQNNIILNLNTSALIILGGIGFLVIREIRQKKLHWKKYSMHTRVVICMSLFLIITGTLFIKLSERSDISWLGAFFFSVSSRTAGFSTFNVGGFASATLLVIIVLMFIGASPGSTGGGIKTTTLFVLIQGIKSVATNKQEKAFHYSIPKSAFKKASVIVVISSAIVIGSTYLLLLFEPKINFLDALFEMVSAFGTVGLSTGITPGLSSASKILSIVVMYIGRIGPLTVLSFWNYSRIERYYYPEGNISIG